MEIIPAIDLQNGRCVRLVQGVFEDSTAYGDPVAFAHRWVAMGARRLHIVDLDGARSGVPNAANLAIVKRIADDVGVPIQMGGGLRTAAAIDGALSAGVDRVILGTRLATDREAAQSLIARFGESLVIGIDARDGRVAVAGWTEVLSVRATDFALQMVNAGARRVVFTDIARDGMLRGVNVPALTSMLDAVEVPVIASGGVQNRDDIAALAALERPSLEGVIVGKALYAGTLDLADALIVAKAG